MSLHIFAAALISSTALSPAIADVKDDASVKANIKLAAAWVQKQIDYNNVPGASIAVVYDQEVVWSTGFGYAHIARQVKASADTKYSICSVSKLFTSIGVMQQRDAGKLSLDAPLNSILEWYDLPPHKDAEEPVTLRNILSHVSGLPREAVTPYWTEVKFPTKKQLREGLSEQKAYYRPYENWQYSNLGLSLAGEALSAASGEDYHAYVKANILDPLNMDNTVSELPTDNYGKSIAAGYFLKDSNGKREEVGPYTTNAIAPAAGFASSVNDLAKFASWQFRLQEKGGTEIIKSTTLREMQRVHWTVPDGDSPVWGLGFAMSKVDGKSFVGHGGYCPGYRTAFLTRPDDKLAIIAMVNVNDFSPSSLATGIAGLMADSVKKASDASSEKDKKKAGDFSFYEGTYAFTSMPISVTFVATDKGLKSVDPFSTNPKRSVTNYVAEEEHTFRVMSRDDKPLYTIHFDVDENGKATRVWEHGQYMDRAKE